MKNKITLLLIIALGFLSFETFSQTPWEIDKNKDGIKVFTRFEKNSEFKSFKATMRVDASTDEIIKILRNAGNYKKWYGYTKTSRLLKQENDVQYNYVETIFPWPFRNRDMVYRMTIKALSTGAIKIYMKGIPNQIQLKKRIVRMEKAEGYILLQPSNGQTEIIYVFHSEPGDTIPAWMANSSIAKLPFKTLFGLRKILKEEKGD